MKLPAEPFRVAAHRPLSFRRQVWYLQLSHRCVHNAGMTGRDEPQKPQPHVRQRQPPQKPWQFRDVETPVRRTPSPPPPDIGVDIDTALQQAIVNLKVARAEDAPLMDYTRSSMPPKVAELCHKVGLSMPHTKRDFFERRMALEFTLSRKHCFHDYHVRDIVDSLSPFQDWALDVHIARHEKEPLWLNVIELGGKKVKPVVKTRGVKRAKHAFAEALRRNGYDRYGNPSSEKEAQQAGTKPASAGLYGTVRVRLFDLKKFCSIPYAEVVEFWERHIAERIRNQLDARAGQDGEIVVRRTASGGGKTTPNTDSRRGYQHKRTATEGISTHNQGVPSGIGRGRDRLSQTKDGSSSGAETRSEAPRPARPSRQVRPKKVSFI